MHILSILLSIALGFIAINALTHDRSRIKSRMPNVIIGKVQIFPVLRIQIRGSVIHFHHWFHFSLMLGYSFIASAGILDHSFTRGILLGGIIQGLSLPKEYRKIIYREHPVLPPLKSR